MRNSIALEQPSDLDEAIPLEAIFQLSEVLASVHHPDGRPPKPKNLPPAFEPPKDWTPNADEPGQGA